jgi:hypothetical protein
VDVFTANWNRLSLVFQDFNAHTVWRHDEGLVQPVVVASKHRNARGLPLGDPLLDVVDD